MLDEIEASDTEVTKERIKLQYHWYLTIFFIIYYLSYVIAGIIFMSYIVYIFVPYVLLVDNLIAIFTNFYSLLALIALPFVIIVSYLSRLFVIGIVTRFFWRLTERISPTKDGIIPRNIPSKAANFYHIRSFMIKYGKNIFKKGVFPWLANWFFNFTGSNVIEKGTTFEESIGNDKNIYVGKNCYIGVDATLASHVVEGVFGNIIYFKVKAGDNVTLSGLNPVGPGSELEDDSYIFPMAAATKFNKTKGNNYYYGMPLRRIFKKKIMNYLKISEDDLNRAEELRVRRENQKKERELKVSNKEN